MLEERGRSSISTLRQGKGSHGRVYLGEFLTTVPHGELGTGLLASMLRDLHIDREEF